MVSKNRHNHHFVSLPADWSLPKIHLTQSLQAKTVLPDTTHTQTGEIP